MSAPVDQKTTPPRTDPRIDESFRSLRATVKFATGERPIRSVLVVDVDRETPSGVAERLATAFAEAGDSCVLIDTDSRATTDRDPGLFDLMSGSGSVESVGRTDDSLRLVRVSPGTASYPDSLAGSQFGNAVESLVDAHGVAVFSCASLPRFADALAIAPRVDAVIMVVTSGGTRRPRAIDARDALDRVGARILGVVMVEGQKRRFW